MYTSLNRTTVYTLNRSFHIFCVPESTRRPGTHAALKRRLRSPPERSAQSALFLQHEFEKPANGSKCVTGIGSLTI